MVYLEQIPEKDKENSNREKYQQLPQYLDDQYFHNNIEKKIRLKRVLSFF